MLQTQWINHWLRLLPASLLPRISTYKTLTRAVSSDSSRWRLQFSATLWNVSLAHPRPNSLLHRFESHDASVGLAKLVALFAASRRHCFRCLLVSDLAHRALSHIALSHIAGQRFSSNHLVQEAKWRSRRAASALERGKTAA